MTEIDVLKNELKCIKRQNGSICDNKRDCQSCDLVMNDKDIVFAYKNAISALEKQIPKKPILDKEQTMRYVMTFTCPTCGKGFTGTKVCSYCYHCGQALDWSDEE